ncbi:MULTISPECIES: thiamine pyrophosphate-dependent dehydrogenase E1 component subunit alpha [Pseudoalteromonas]|uniref:2-oxoisovalerate dehydrogenase subunit alpha n=2 Tax=Pseudoalteromonas TaxID=53246 RepID=Q3IGV4_PSET1|nr:MULTISPECIES: thiamine pyrophosphate-dependent dehydrogenase E1 component subunit alpha [Pseudoalteromonas]ASM54193.1 2-oxoisovalerate dehydrogenase E1 component alpha subunit [Pseudoalteromonas nigrifaciens]MBB1369549.1 thiamine pyrophosphate-dependent dehydrogenase E1 component subunit alpha [Pseudoalteromonas sp. SR45-4]MBB1404773.1 thiamine pyrophosphate-dependent dehydrogenase E1 component subunit alpha [Pseudoalteromonas sp. SG44-5]MBH0092624.1 thiamine pyrophosphate-dependent dehydrog|tara:strand:+ start:45265 stop:46479 length:1215 start_codon:yes stop_codon:yes gene_type:complete
MSNPNNVSLNINHKLEFIDGNALTIPTLSILTEDGEIHPGATAPDISKHTAIKLYETMRFIRLLDERMQGAQRQGRISFYMQCLGEEAAVTASAAALDQNDMIMAQYREQAALHYRGFTLDQFMNQMFSNELDLGKGRQMPIHYGSKALNYMTISSPLGTQIPQATGYAYGQKIKHIDAKTGELASTIDNITICYFGEGAASEGDFHAGVNMAAVHQAPVIFFARNNGYAISTPADEQFKGDGIASRGVGYGIKTIRVDGTDALAVYAATKKAREIAVSTGEPILIESIAYRLGAHSTSDDPSGYRSKDEEANHQVCPIDKFRKWLIKQDWLNEADDVKAKESIREEILAALKRAEVVAKPALEELISDVYDTPIPSLQRQYEQLKAHIKLHPDAYPVTAGRIK